jgi:hypothetical protein
MTAVRSAPQAHALRTFSSVLAAFLVTVPIGLHGDPAMAEPMELETTQLIERGQWGDIGCFGRTLDVENGVAVVGDPCDEMTSGAAYAFALQPSGLWEETWHYAKGTGYEDDHFGAAVSIDAGRVVIGEPAIRGSVHFYNVLPGGILDLQSTYRYPGTEYVVLFGSRVAIDGQTVLSGSTVRSQIYVLEEEGAEWSEVGRIAADPVFDLDDGVFLVGDPGDDVAGENAGAVRTFVRNRRGHWREREAIRLDDAFPGQFFGQSVAIDGDRALIGATGRSTQGVSTGVAYVFERQSGGAWRQAARLDQAEAPACVSTRGKIVALSDDTALVASGAYHCAVAVFSREPDGNWTHVARLVGEGVTADSPFGAAAVALDPPWVVVGTPNQPHAADDEVWGAVHFFDLSLLETVRQVAIDVLPWSESNVIDPGSRSLVAVAVFSSAEFDALQTDLTTIRMNPGDARARNYRVMDVDRNGIPDLLFWIRSRDLDIGCGETDIELSARTHGGLTIAGSDAVTHRWCQGP